MLVSLRPVRHSGAKPRRLATALELADLDTGEGPGALLDQHFACCEMLEAMKKLDLGKYL